MPDTRKIAFFAAFGLASCVSSEPQAPVRLVAGVDAHGRCTLTLDGQPISAEDVPAKLKGRTSNSVALSGLSTTVPYRCVGAVIFELQHANIPVKLGFLSEPPTAGSAQ